MDMRRRLDDSAASTALASLALVTAWTEIPFRITCSTDMFEKVQQVMRTTQEINSQYVMAHPWRVWIGTALLDQEFWENLLAGMVTGHTLAEEML